jgi:hypothetical protein
MHSLNMTGNSMPSWQRFLSTATVNGTLNIALSDSSEIKSEQCVVRVREYCPRCGTVAFNSF